MTNKWPVLTQREVIAAFSRIGYKLYSQKGSHAKYTNGIRKIVIPIHDTIDRYTLKNILIQANIRLDKFMKLLK